MFKLLKQLFAAEPPIPRDFLVEGVYADQYSEDHQQLQIRTEYRRRWPEPGSSPETHPWLFDPCDPPEGWRYDPYYELWLKL